MPFDFPLDTLLRLRVSYERKERMRLEEIARRIAGVKLRIAELESEQRQASQGVSRGLQEGVTAAEMHFAGACDEVREEQLRALANQLIELQKEHRQQQDVYLEARQKREILENLRDGQLAAYRRDQERRQQQAVDDLFLMRAGRNIGAPKENLAT